MALKKDSSLAIEAKIAGMGLRDTKPKQEPRQKREFPGRPPKEKEALTDKFIAVGVSHTDFKSFKAYCDSAGVSVSTKVRELIIKFMLQNGIK